MSVDSVRAAAAATAAGAGALPRGAGGTAAAGENAALALRIAQTLAIFLALVAAFFLLIGRNPLTAIGAVVDAAAGSGYAVGESLLRATPILLCALATLLPARIGLVSVGAEGQLYAGAIGGTAVLLVAPAAPGVVLLPAVLLGGIAGGMLYALLPALLRVGANVNETISTLMLNYVAMLAVTWLVYGPWKDPASQGWPATIAFPPAARLPVLDGSRVHLGLLLALGIAGGLWFLFQRTRWGLLQDVLRSNPRLEALLGVSLRGQLLLAMAAGGAVAGLAGIVEAAMVQGRLQSDLSNGAGLSGFLVAWLAGGRVLPAVVLALLLGALLAAGDGLQMNAQIPSSATLVVQGLLFVAVLGAPAWRLRRA